MAFDTKVALTVVCETEREANDALSAGFAEIRRLERVASLTCPGSEICRLNASGRLSRPDPALVEMLDVADQVRRATNGAFDVTIQPLWIFYDSFAKRGEWPSDEQSAPMRDLIGQSLISFDASEIAFAKPGMGITLNSLTHGYAADRVARVLAEKGVKQAFVDTGEMEAMDVGPEGRAWTAAIQHPRKPDSMLGALPMTGCLATAGDYQYYWSEDFSRNHILDPRNGVSPASFSSVSVIARTAVLADALSTAVCVVGAQEAEQLLRHFEAEAYGVTKDGAIWSTPGFPRQSLA
jgi:thiamine biosynthesis lipoprotein